MNQRPSKSNVTPISRGRTPVASAKVNARLSFDGIGGRFQAIFRSFVAGQSLLFYFTLGVTVILALFGVVMVLSASSIQSIRETGGPFSYAWRQGLFALIGFTGLIAFSLLPVEFFARFSRAYFVFWMIVQAAAVTVGKNVNGNKEWIELGPFTIQPSEFLKLGFIVAMAYHFHQRQGHEADGRYYAWSSLWYPGIAAAGVMAGKDLGTTIVLVMIAMVVLWLAETPGIFMRIPLLAALVGILFFALAFGNRSSRITAWLNPGNNDQANNLVWQSMHGVWALANSNGIGRGLGMSSLKWSWIPEVQNDYIFAIIGEELGFAGAIATVLLFVALGYFILQIAARAQDLFSRMICYGVAAWFVIQSFINIAVVLTLLPVLGVPLPFISYGGSSLISDLLAVGVVLSIERRNHRVLDGAGRGPLRRQR